MKDLSSDLNELLKARRAQPVDLTPYSLERVNDFLKEAYNIVSLAEETLIMRRPPLTSLVSRMTAYASS